MTKILQEYKNYLKIKDYHISYYYNILPFIKYIREEKSNIYNNTLSLSKEREKNIYNNKEEKESIIFSYIEYNALSSYLLSLKEKNLSNGYINNLINSLKCFYKFLIKQDIIAKDRQEHIAGVLDKVTLLKTEQKIRDSFSIEELNDILEMGLSFLTFISAVKLKAILLLLFYTGLRRQEFLDLKRSNINLKDNSLIVRIPTKNREERVVFFPKRVNIALEEYFRDEEENINAFNITDAQLKYLIQQLKPFAPKDKDFSIHTFRHSFANLLASKEVDIRVAQKLLGHKSLESTIIYYNPDINTIKKIYKEKIK